MNTKGTISITEARKKIFDIAEEVQRPGAYYTLTENGRPKAVMLSAEEFESLIETLDVMEYFPDLDEDIKQAERNSTAGKTIPLEYVLAKHGYLVADANPKEKVSRRSRSPRRKSPRQS